MKKKSTKHPLIPIEWTPAFRLREWKWGASGIIKGFARQATAELIKKRIKNPIFGGKYVEFKYDLAYSDETIDVYTHGDIAFSYTEMLQKLEGKIRKRIDHLNGRAATLISEAGDYQAEARNFEELIDAFKVKADAE